MQAERKIKVIGSSGQISLGKEYAGKAVIVEETQKGVWIVKLAHVIAENERWMDEEPNKSRISRGLAWQAGNPPDETDVEAFCEQIEKGLAGSE